MQPTNADRLISDVKAHSGLDDDNTASDVIRATLRALGSRLPASCADVIAHGLPGPYADALRNPPDRGDFDLPELYRRVADATGAELPRAVEYACTVCRALSTRLDEEARSHLQRHLPQEMLNLFVEPSRAEPAAPPLAPAEAPWRTLATSRPGSRRPLSEANPAEIHADSVAATDEPHGGRKLSSGHRTIDDD